MTTSNFDPSSDELAARKLHRICYTINSILLLQKQKECLDELENDKTRPFHDSGTIIAIKELKCVTIAFLEVLENYKPGAIPLWQVYRDVKILGNVIESINRARHSSIDSLLVEYEESMWEALRSDDNQVIFFSLHNEPSIQVYFLTRFFLSSLEEKYKLDVKSEGPRPELINVRLVQFEEEDLHPHANTLHELGHAWVYYNRYYLQWCAGFRYKNLRPIEESIRETILGRIYDVSVKSLDGSTKITLRLGDKSVEKYLDSHTPDIEAEKIFIVEAYNNLINPVVTKLIDEIMADMVAAELVGPSYVVAMYDTSLIKRDYDKNTDPEVLRNIPVGYELISEFDWYITLSKDSFYTDAHPNFHFRLKYLCDQDYCSAPKEPGEQDKNGFQVFCSRVAEELEKFQEELPDPYIIQNIRKLASLAIYIEPGKQDSESCEADGDPGGKEIEDIIISWADIYPHNSVDLSVLREILKKHLPQTKQFFLELAHHVRAKIKEELDVIRKTNDQMASLPNMTDPAVVADLIVRIENNHTPKFFRKGDRKIQADCRSIFCASSFCRITRLINLVDIDESSHERMRISKELIRISKLTKQAL